MDDWGTPEGLLLGFGALVFGGALALPLSNLLHEAGHLVLALLLTPSSVELRIGSRPSRRLNLSSRLQLNIGFRDLHRGAVRYRSTGLPPWRRVLIAAGGPLVSLLLVGVAGMFLFSGAAEWVAPRILGGIFLLANLHLFIVTALPRGASGTDPSAWISDGDQIRLALNGRAGVNQRS